MYKVGIITASDKGAKGQRKDLSGPKIQEIVEAHGLEVAAYAIVADEKDALQKEMIRQSDQVGVELILTTGGTGFSHRDVTPEASKEICQRDALAIVQAINIYSLSITKRAMLSRAYSGIRNNTLIVNLPGSPKAVDEALNYVIDSLLHGLDILLANDSECAR